MHSVARQSTSDEALIFELEQIRFGVWSSDIRQVLRAVAISPLPNAPSCIEGIINVHGHVVPVLDLRELFRLPAKPIEITDHLIVVEIANSQVAIRVDRALDLISLDVENLEETRVMLGGVKFKSLTGKTSLGLIHVLAADELMSQYELSMLDNLVHQSVEESDGEAQ